MNETVKKFFPTNVCFLMWSIKWRCEQIDKRKTFLWQFFLWEWMSVCTTEVICFTFVLWRLTSYFLVFFFVFFNLSLFGCFSFWVTTCFLKVICPRYHPENIRSGIKTKNLPITTRFCLWLFYKDVL